MRIKARRVRGRFPGRAGKVYEMKGEGWLTSRLGKLAKRAGKTFVRGAKAVGREALGQAKVLAPAVAKNLAPELIAYGSNKLAQKASQKGAPDMAANAISKLGQRGAQKVRDSKGAQLSKNQKLVSDFISGQSADLLGNLLARNGNGVRRAGMGVRGFGSGVRGFGVRGHGLQVEQAPKLN